MTPYQALYVLPLLLIAVAAGWLLLIGWQRRSARGAGAFVVLMAGVGWWALSNALEYFGPTESLAMLWNRLQYVGVTIIPVAWLVFALQYTGRAEKLSRLGIALLLAVPLVAQIAIWTNPLYGLWATSIEARSLQGVWIIKSARGVLFWLNASYSYILLLIGSLLLLQSYRQAPRAYRGQSGALLLAGFLPWFANALYLAGASPLPEVDLTPFAFTATGAVMAWSLFRHQLLDLVPVARATLIESMGDAIVVLDMQNRIVDLNSAARSLAGEIDGSLVGRSGRYFMDRHPQLEKGFRNGWVDHTEVVLGQDSATRTYDVRVSPIFDRSESLSGRVIVLRDITELRQTTDELERARETLALSVRELELRNRQITLLRNMGHQMQGAQTVEQCYTLLAEFAPQLFPWRCGALYLCDEGGLRPDPVVRWGDGECLEQTSPPADWLASEGNLGEADKNYGQPLEAREGCSRWQLCARMPVHQETFGVLCLREPRSEEGDLFSEPMQRQLALAVAEQVGLALSNVTLSEQLRHQAVRDPLTGLFNRRYLEKTMARELERADRSHRPVGVIMLDIDHFKAFNDDYGHAAGDMILQELAKFLQVGVRESDFVCRYGGEEFVLVMPNASLDLTSARAESLRQGVSSLSQIYDGIRLRALTLSMGVAAFPEHGKSTDKLLRAADEALYHAKALGRDRVERAS